MLIVLDRRCDPLAYKVQRAREIGSVSLLLVNLMAENLDQHRMPLEVLLAQHPDARNSCSCRGVRILRCIVLVLFYSNIPSLLFLFFPKGRRRCHYRWRTTTRAAQQRRRRAPTWPAGHPGPKRGHPWSI